MFVQRSKRTEAEKSYACLHAEMGQWEAKRRESDKELKDLRGRLKLLLEANPDAEKRAEAFAAKRAEEERKKREEREARRHQRDGAAQVQALLGEMKEG